MSDEPIRWPDVLDHLLGGRDLDEATAHRLMAALMAGEGEPAQVAGVLVALRAKGESSAEIAGFVRGMIGAASRIDLTAELRARLVDTCGTGGDGAGTFNISTVAAVVVAASGVPVAKHGNRAASGRFGSADLLEAWGVRIDLSGPAVATCIDELGIGFLFARSFHPAMRHVGPIRSQLGIRTAFNLLGPLSNPAGAPHQVVGVPDASLAAVMASALARLGRRRALVVRGDDGLDELSTTAPSTVWEVADGEVSEWRFDPSDVGLPRAAAGDLLGGGLEENVRIADAVLAGEPGPRADIVALNAGAALYVAGSVADLADGVTRAQRVLADRRALELRDRWVERSQELADDD